jgi:hypothetical protein
LTYFCKYNKIGFFPLFPRAKKELDDNLSVVTTWPEFLSALDKNHLIQVKSAERKKCFSRVGRREFF